MIYGASIMQNETSPSLLPAKHKALPLYKLLLLLLYIYILTYTYSFTNPLSAQVGLNVEIFMKRAKLQCAIKSNI